jgi:hypothetical protein
LEPLDALTRLLNDRVWLGYPLERAVIERFLHWFATVPAFAIRYSSVPDAVSCVRSVLGA